MFFDIHIHKSFLGESQTLPIKSEVWSGKVGCGSGVQVKCIKKTKGAKGYPIIFASNVFHNSHLIQKCIQNQQQLLILYTLLNQMRVVKNI